MSWVTYGSSRLILVGLGNLRFLQVNPSSDPHHTSHLPTITSTPMFVIVVIIFVFVAVAIPVAVVLPNQRCRAFAAAKRCGLSAPALGGRGGGVERTAPGMESAHYIR